MQPVACTVSEVQVAVGQLENEHDPIPYVQGVDVVHVEPPPQVPFVVALPEQYANTAASMAVGEV